MKKIYLFLFCLCFSGLLYSQEKPEGLFIGSRAPDFRATDQQGQEIRLRDLLKKGKVVLVFYRGYWCPYCNKELSRLQDSLGLLTEKGATVLAITPELPEGIAKTVEKTGVSFPVIHDRELKIMKSYDVEFEVEENSLSRYRSGGVDIEKNNGKNGKYLPVPAVYIIDKESYITYRFFESDYRKRPSVKELLANL